MTDTTEAVRLASRLLVSGLDADEEQVVAALLCRIPELETARDVAVELAAKYAAERDQLRAELEKVRCLDVDDLAQFIRQIEGRHNMGAGALAELIVEWFYATQTPPNADQKGQ